MALYSAMSLGVLSSIAYRRVPRLIAKDLKPLNCRLILAKGCGQVFKRLGVNIL